MKLDATMLAALLQCPERFRLRYLQGYAFDGDSWPLIAGQAMHTALHRWFAEPTSNLGAAQVALRAAWPQPYRLQPTVPKLQKYSLGAFELLLERYAEQWPREEDDFDVIANEAYIEATLTTVAGVEYGFHGIRDRKIRKHEDGQLYVMDSKTTGLYLTEDYKKDFELSPQLRAYVGMELINGEDVVGAYIDAIHIGNTDKTVPFCRFKVLFPDWAISQWAREVEMALRLLDVYGEADRRWPQFGAATGACRGFGARCPAWELCVMDPASAETEAGLRWRVERWNPAAVARDRESLAAGPSQGTGDRGGTDVRVSELTGACEAADPGDGADPAAAGGVGAGRGGAAGEGDAVDDGADARRAVQPEGRA